MEYGGKGNVPSRSSITLFWTWKSSELPGARSTTTTMSTRFRLHFGVGVVGGTVVGVVGGAVVDTVGVDGAVVDTVGVGGAVGGTVGVVGGAVSGTVGVVGGAVDGSVTGG